MEEKLKRIFEKPGKEFRSAPFWAWNTKPEKKDIVKQIKIFEKMGFGGYHIHSRVGLNVPYLGDEFMDLVSESISLGKKMGMVTRLYDEDRWPSGFGGGMVTSTEKYRMRHLLFTMNPYDGEISERDMNRMGNFANGVRSQNGQLLSCYDVVLNSQGELDYYKRIGAEDSAVGMKWYAYEESNPIHSWYNDTSYVDVLNEEAIAEFLQCTHEKYRERFGEEFGKAIPSIFTDEPHMTFKTVLSNPWSNKDCFIPWTLKLPDRFQEEYEFSILDHLPEIFWERSDGVMSAARYCYHKMTADLFEEAFAKQIGEWCRQNGIDFTGHYLYEETLHDQCRSDGDLLRMYRHMDIPGMDLLFNEVALTTIKQVQSIVHQYGKKGAMSELYGVTNYSSDFRRYKFQGDWQAALGITLRVPHLSLMTLEGEAKRDFPASIFYQTPWYQKFYLLEDHFARVNALLSEGEACTNLAVIHPLESYWSAFGPESVTAAMRNEMDEKFLNLANWLLCNGIDFDYISEGLIEELCPEVQNPLKAGKMEYTHILIPACRTLRKSTWEILRKFSEKGGTLVIAGCFPKILEKNGKVIDTEFIEDCIPYDKYSILNAVRECRQLKISDEFDVNCEGFVYQLKRRENGDAVLFLAHIQEPENQDSAEFKKIQISIPGNYHVLKLNTLTGEIESANISYKNANTVIHENVYEYESLLFYLELNEGKMAAMHSDEHAPEVSVKKIQMPNLIDYKLDEQNVLVLDQATAYLDGEFFAEGEEILRIDQKLREKLGFEQRTFSMMQPYLRKKEKLEHSLTLIYEVNSDVELEKVFLALECRDQTEIYWNGNIVVGKEEGWYIDEKIKKVEIGKVIKGKNSLELKLKFGTETGLEAVYLLGDFGVSVFGKNVRIGAKKERIAFGSVVNQGLAFYGGNIRYKFDVECSSDYMEISIPKFRGGLVEVFIDGISEGVVFLAPYHLRIRNKKSGKHQVELCLYGNRENTLGHFHCADDSKKNSSMPNLWRCQGNSWCYEYNLQPFGIMAEPELYEIEM